LHLSPLSLRALLKDCRAAWFFVFFLTLLAVCFFAPCRPGHYVSGFCGGSCSYSAAQYIRTACILAVVGIFYAGRSPWQLRSEAMKTDKKTEQWLKREDRRHRKGGLDRPSYREWRRENALASWLGEERRAEVFADLRPEPKSMRELLDETMAAVGKKDMFLLADLREHWADIVGTDNARQSSPLSIHEKILRIEIASPTWFYVFEHQQKAHFAQLLRDYSKGAIADIQFVPQGYRPPRRF
jgi:hypothetical protein